MWVVIAYEAAGIHEGSIGAQFAPKWDPTNLVGNRMQRVSWLWPPIVQWRYGKALPFAHMARSVRHSAESSLWADTPHIARVCGIGSMAGDSGRRGVPHLCATSPVRDKVGGG
jgi:hypothetical protein